MCYNYNVVSVSIIEQRRSKLVKSTAEKVEKNKVRIEIQVDAQDFERP